MLKKMFPIAFAALLFISCEPTQTYENTCPLIIGVSTTSVTGPIETLVDVPILLEVSYKAKKNCGGFSSFFKNVSTDTLVDIITTNTSYDACNCDEVETTETKNYSFEKAASGVYTVKFKKTNETFVEHIITVQ
jgi:uncharacterized protein YkuJ